MTNETKTAWERLQKATADLEMHQRLNASDDLEAAIAHERALIEYGQAKNAFSEAVRKEMQAAETVRWADNLKARGGP